MLDVWSENDYQLIFLRYEYVDYAIVMTKQPFSSIFKETKTKCFQKERLDSKAANANVNLTRYLSLRCKDKKKPEKTEGWMVSEEASISPFAARCFHLSKTAFLAVACIFTDFQRLFLSSTGHLF